MQSDIHHSGQKGAKEASESEAFLKLVNSLARAAAAAPREIGD